MIEAVDELGSLFAVCARSAWLRWIESNYAASRSGDRERPHGPPATSPPGWCATRSRRPLTDPELVSILCTEDPFASNRRNDDAAVFGQADSSIRKATRSSPGVAGECGLNWSGLFRYSDSDGSCCGYLVLVAVG